MRYFSLSVVVIVLAAISSAWLYFRNVDKQVYEFIKVSAPAISKDWEEDVLKRYFSDELFSSFLSDGGVEISSALGYLKKCSGSPDNNLEIYFTGPLLAHASLECMFDNGSALMVLDIIDVDGEMKYSRFELKPLMAEVLPQSK